MFENCVLGLQNFCFENPQNVGRSTVPVPSVSGGNDVALIITFCTTYNCIFTPKIQCEVLEITIQCVSCTDVLNTVVAGCLGGWRLLLQQSSSYYRSKTSCPHSAS